jgi:hypothetical protein
MALISPLDQYTSIKIGMPASSFSILWLYLQDRGMISQRPIDISIDIYGSVPIDVSFWQWGILKETISFW